MISYDVDGKDGAGRSPGNVLRTVQEQVHDGAIIRLHDSSDNAAEAVDLITEWLHANGYLCVTVEDLFIHNQQEMVPNEVFRNVTPKY